MEEGRRLVTLGGPHALPWGQTSLSLHSETGMGAGTLGVHKVPVLVEVPWPPPVPCTPTRVWECGREAQGARARVEPVHFLPVLSAPWYFAVLASCLFLLLPEALGPLSPLPCLCG